MLNSVVYGTLGFSYQFGLVWFGLVCFNPPRLTSLGATGQLRRANQLAAEATAHPLSSLLKAEGLARTAYKAPPTEGVPP